MLQRFAFFFVVIVTATSINAEEEIYSDREFRDWSVFIDSGDCWLAAYPKDQQQNDIKDITIYITFHQKSMNSEISVLFEGDLMDVSDVDIVLGGKPYALDVDDDTAFTATSENMTILKKMLSYEPTTLSFSTSGEEYREFSVEYEGLRDAYNFTSKNCDFFRNGDIDGDIQKESV